jgi:hypothetical protein
VRDARPAPHGFGAVTTRSGLTRDGCMVPALVADLPRGRAAAACVIIVAALTPASIDVGDNTVRLEGSDMQDENLLHVIGRHGRPVILVVVPPEASDAAGHSAIVAAGRRGYPETPTEILTTCGVLGRTAGTSESRGTCDDGPERWEADGGYADMPLRDR